MTVPSITLADYTAACTDRERDRRARFGYSKREDYERRFEHYWAEICMRGEDSIKRKSGQYFEPTTMEEVRESIAGKPYRDLHRAGINAIDDHCPCEEQS